VSEEKLKFIRDLYSNMTKSKKGLHWREVEMAIQNIMDHYAGDVRAAPMLSRGSERLKDVRRNASFRAENAHELMRCLEVRSILDNAEMILMASQERTESRKAPFGFFRADFPEQDDKNWLAFLALKLEGEEIKFKKIPIKQ
jgi:succinate dehydrogenase/fumarate reductase flavoprotein subunit